MSLTCTLKMVKIIHFRVYVFHIIFLKKANKTFLDKKIISREITNHVASRKLHCTFMIEYILKHR